MTETWDTSIRLVAIGASLLLLAVLLAGQMRAGMKLALCGLTLGAAAYLVNSAPAFAPPSAIDPFVDLVSLLTPFWIWFFARQLFERPAPRGLIPAFLLVFLTGWFTGNYLPPTRPFGFYAIHIASLLLVADLLWTAWSGRNDDLIEKRRMIRLWLPILVGLQAGGILLFETITGGAIVVPWIQGVNAMLIFALTLFCGVVLMQTDPVLLVETEESGPSQPVTPELSPVETVLREKLEAAMADGFYRTPGLTISGLADHLDTPEHRLRALINRRLGYRNFSSFLNHHRLAEAKQMLADPEHVDLPILSIAMDLGYNSLPTFNRAFRAETSVTPSDFRKSAIGQN